MHDVIIIGGRCAGASLALLLARAGLRALVIERAVFPSDTMSGHYIHPAGVSCLRRWGLGGLLAATGAPAQRRITVDFGPVALGGTPAPAPDGTTEAFAPRRYVFDTLLAEAAAASGVDFRDGTSFLEPLVEDGRVVGVRAAGPGGREETLSARLVVGADGKRSRLAVPWARRATTRARRRPAPTMPTGTISTPTRLGSLCATAASPSWRPPTTG